MWYITIFRLFLLFIIKTYSQAILTQLSAQSKMCISTIASGTRRYIKSSKAIKSISINTYGNCELDSHADSIVAGSNCVILNYTGKECDVAPYREDYDTIPNVPIVTAATAWQSPNTGQIYISVTSQLAVIKGKLAPNSRGIRKS